MPIQDTDLLLIEDTSGASKKIEASKLKANLAANTYNNYKLLVNKPDYSSGFVYAQNMQASVTPADYMLIERAGVSYKVTGQQIIDYFPSVPAGAAGPITDVENTTVDGAWTFTQPAAGVRWEGVAYGLGLFVAVSRDLGQIWTSSDNAETWTKRYELANAEWKSITFGNGRFVAVSDGPSTVKAIYSDDGIAWIEADDQLNHPWQSVAYGDDRYVAVGHSNGRSMYSTDGKSWTIGYMDAEYWTRVVYGGDKFCAVNNTNGKYIAYSTDGASWTNARHDPAEAYKWVSLAYGNGEFIANTEGTNTKIMRSTNGTDWALDDMGTSLSGRSGAFGGGTFVFAYGSKVVYSTNAAATTWAETIIESGSYKDIAYGNGYFVAVDNGSSTCYISRSYGGTGGVALDSQLTLASDTNLELFTVGDKINMVDSDGNVVNYGPQTSALTSVTETDYTNTIVATSFTYLSDQDFSYGSLSNVFNRAYDSRGFTSNGYGIAPNVSHPSANPYRWHLYTFPSPITVQESFMMDIYDGNYVEGQASLGFIDSEGNETLTNLAVEDRIITNFSGYRYAIPGLAPGTVITAVKYRIDPLGPKSSKRCIDLVYALIHDGLVLTDGIKKLNFASPNPDLSLFKEGTIVNGINTTINTSYDWSTGWRISSTGIGNLTNSFDGDVNTWGMLMDSTNVGAGKPITGYWDVKESPYINNRRSQIYVRPGAEIEFKIKTNGLTGEIKIFEITGEYESSTNLLATYDAKPARTETIIYTQPEGYWLQGISGNRGSNTSGRATIELAYMKIDGVMLVDGTDRATAEVQTVDLADNCMYVNNGDFSPPNTVSAEGVSGTGNFNGYSGNIVDVINSNQEWVADPNHFIKPASTRTGLAILRTKAVAAATEIAQSVSEIPEGSFAIVKNNYWFRDEDNLIDLGPTNLPTK